ncbi:response regulator [Bacillus weihaiensis]|uniref:response regulator n=1 Tax=Bacillus weihaiensis TaxID=1547283 RepID=UPI002357F0B7|nr:response regulator [Bacillus weihaiensis]
MNIIIVDDEMIERKAMKKFIEESFSHIRVIAEAQNGRMAIEKAREHKPDVMIMDIRMPGINGLDAIELIKKELPHTKFIMVSAYDSFEYAKSAMKFGVKEYILKPSQKQETLEALIRVEKEIMAEKVHVVETQNLANQQVISAIIQNEITAETKRHFKSEGMSFFYMIQSQGAHQNLLDVLHEKVKLPYILKEVGSKLAVLVQSEKKTTHHAKADALTIARSLTQSFHEKTIIGIGLPYMEVTKLPISYQQALLAATQLEKEANVRYGFADSEERRDQDTIRKLEQSLLNEIMAGRVEQATDYYNLIEEQCSLGIFEAATLIRLRELALRMKQAVDIERGSTDAVPSGDLDTINDIRIFIKKLCEYMILYKAKHDAIALAKVYIQKHYKESLSLEEVAAYVDLTPTYFTKLFKEETRQTFIEYVTEARIEKAKHLLLQTKDSLKEIAFEVGYKDPNYFSRVFKKMVNMSPKQYRSTTSTTK